MPEGVEFHEEPIYTPVNTKKPEKDISIINALVEKKVAKDTAHASKQLTITAGICFVLALGTIIWVQVHNAGIRKENERIDRINAGLIVR